NPTTTPCGPGSRNTSIRPKHKQYRNTYMSYLNETHDPALQSWVASANVADNGFPIQNLPFGIFRPAGSKESLRPGVAIGDKVLDLAALAKAKPWTGAAAKALAACEQTSTLNELMALGQDHWSALR